MWSRMKKGKNGPWSVLVGTNSVQLVCLFMLPLSSFADNRRKPSLSIMAIPRKSRRGFHGCTKGKKIVYDYFHSEVEIWTTVIPLDWWLHEKGRKKKAMHKNKKWNSWRRTKEVVQKNKNWRAYSSIVHRLAFSLLFSFGFYGKTIKQGKEQPFHSLR